MPDWINLLFTHTWWSWPRDAAMPYSFVYRGFNLAEGVAWTVCAGIVLRRFLVHRHSGFEVLYAAAFLMFGMTDFVEVSRQTSWLIWLKGINLLVLLAVRRHVRKRYYPESRVL